MGNERTNVNVDAMVEELGIRNEDKQALVDKANKAVEAFEQAKRRLEVANEALVAADEQPDVVSEAKNYGEKLAELGLDEKVIRSTLRQKFATKRVSRSDEGASLTDDIKKEMRQVVDNTDENGFTVSQLAKQFEVKRTCVATWVKELVEGAEVVQTGVKRGTKYFLAGFQPSEDAGEDVA